MRDTAPHISYAASAGSIGARAAIRMIEHITGRQRLLRRLDVRQVGAAQGHAFWRDTMDAFGLRLDLRRGCLEHIPEVGPLVVVSNHPYGILDGLVMGYLLSGTRRDFRILAHQVFRQAPQVSGCVLPIDFSGTRAALDANLQTRAEALRYLSGGGAIGIFPGGTVSTAPTPFTRPSDPAWRGFSARLIQRSRATVVPVWFDGHNSRLFQIASHLNYTLRMALLIREFRTRVDRPVRMAIGQPIGPETLARHGGNAKELLDFLRGATYQLAEERLDPTHLGYEFEAAYRN